MPLIKNRLNEKGQEVLDPKPHSLLLGSKQPTQFERFIQILNNQKYQQLMRELDHLPDDNDPMDDKDDDGFDDEFGVGEAEYEELKVQAARERAYRLSQFENDPNVASKQFPDGIPQKKPKGKSPAEPKEPKVPASTDAQGEGE